MCVCVCCTFITGSARKILRIRLKKGNGHLGKPAIDTLDCVYDKKTAADLKARKETCIYPWPAWLIPLGKGC